MKKYVITGGPCYGKTTQVNTLANRGYHLVEEAARKIIDEELTNDGKLLPWVDRLGFQKKVIEVQLELESKIPENTIAFLDRGLPDNLAYFKLDGVNPPKEMKKALEKTRYEDKVFLLEELKIFENDTARKEDPAAARKIQQLLEESYRELGYEIIKVPSFNPEKRADYILSKI